MVRDGRVPVDSGGSEPAIRRCGRIADGWYPPAMRPEDFVSGAELLRATAVAAGQDPAAIRITVTPGSADPTKELDRDRARTYVDHGATRLVMHSGVRRPEDMPKVRDRILRYREQVFDPLAEEAQG